MVAKTAGGMENKQSTIEVFFFGSPADGFSSFPKGYKGLVTGLDKNINEEIFKASYEINKNESIIRYVEYGLTGVDRKGGIRGGRNFGIWIQLNSYKINQAGQSNIVPYIKEFMEEGIMASGLFRPNASPKHYLMSSFNDLEITLTKLQGKLKNHFLKDFEESIEPIMPTDSLWINLLLSEEKAKTLLLEGTQAAEPEIILESDAEPKEKNEDEEGTIKKNTLIKKVILKIGLPVVFLLTMITLLIGVSGNDNKEKKTNRNQSEAQPSEKTASAPTPSKTELTDDQIKEMDKEAFEKLGLNEDEINDLPYRQVKLLMEKEFINNPHRNFIREIQKTMGFSGSDADGVWGKNSKSRLKELVEKEKSN